ncbi:serine/threonine-protein kinase haspin [Nematocida displodere]|uniref:Serine/threonine-protein kinase haspin n=1 Tax=Nematocida displodere TaxID=1805483 RepID=A0A177EGZ7_9MICR|nr:serine/threonine-protein kinase haspin [Nematocida displodere]
MKTFQRRGRLGRRSIGVLPAPRIFGLAPGTVFGFSDDENEEPCRKKRKLSLLPPPLPSPVPLPSDVPSHVPIHVPLTPFSHLPLTRVVKLGESTFSEIFIDRETNRVYKIVPLTEDRVYKKITHTKTPLFIKECLIMERMNTISASVEIFRWWIVSGTYPQRLQRCCKQWAYENTSENITPQRNNSSGMFGVIEMEHGGCELDRVDWSTMGKEEVASILKSLEDFVAGIDGQGIEHRDMHESNVLVKKDQKGKYVIKVIDYSLSRMPGYGTPAESVTITESTGKALAYHPGAVLYTDLDKEAPWLFEEEEDEEPHNAVYRAVSAHYTGADRWRGTGNSNLLWHQYLVSWIKARTSAFWG